MLSMVSVLKIFISCVVPSPGLHCSCVTSSSYPHLPLETRVYHRVLAAAAAAATTACSMLMFTARYVVGNPFLPLQQLKQQNQGQQAPLAVHSAPVAPPPLQSGLASSSLQHTLQHTAAPAAAWDTQADPTAAAAAMAGMAGSAGHQSLANQEKAAYIPSSSALGRAQQLTAYISSRRHWSQLQNIWLDNSSSFSDIHLTAAVTRLARLVEVQGVPAADGPELFKFSSAVMSCMRQRLPELDARGAAQGLWAYAKLQACSRHYSSSGDAAADALIQHIAAQHVMHLQRQELSQVAWAVSRLRPQGLTVPVSWWTGLEQRLMELLPEVQPQELACCTWALAKGQHQPTAGFVQAIVSHVTSSDSSSYYGSSSSNSGSNGSRSGSYEGSSNSSSAAPYPVGELLQVLLALGSWQCHLPASVLLHFQQQLQRQVAVMSPQDLSNTMLAFARLSWKPQQPFLATLLQQLQHVLPQCCPRVLVTVPYALAKLGLNPGDGWWAGFIPYTTVSLPSYCPSALAITAWSFARLGVHPGDPWVQEMLQQSGYKLQQQASFGSRSSWGLGFAAQELALLAWALGRWGAAPPVWWWHAFEAATAARIQSFTAAELGALLNGMGKTAPALAAAAATVKTAHSTLGQLLAATSSSSPAYQPDHQDHPLQQQHQWQLQQQLTGYDACHFYHPSRSWCDQVLQAARTALADAPAACLTGVLLGLSRLQVRPNSDWLVAFEGAAMAAMPAAKCQDIAGLLWGYSVLQVQPSAGLLHAAFSRVHEQLQQNRVAARLGRANKLSVGSSSSSSSNSRLPQIVSRGSSMNQSAPRHPWAVSPATAAHLLWAVAILPVPTTAPWVDDMLMTVRSSLSSATCDTLVTLLWSLAKLHHVPGCKNWMDSWWAAYWARMTWQQQQQQQKAFSAVAAETGKQHAAASEVHAARPELHHQLHHQHHPEALVPPALQAAARPDVDDPGLVPPALQAAARPDVDDPGLVPLLLVLSSFRRLRATPSVDSGWLPCMLAAVQQHLPSASSAQLCLLLRQLAQLHVWPGETWLEAAVDALRQRHCMLQDIEVQAAMRDLQTLGLHVTFDREACVV
eukprot:gene12643-biopygen14528